MSGVDSATSIEHELRAICGEENVRERPVGGVYVSPASAEEVTAVLAVANERQLAVCPAGGSTERNAAELHTDILLHLNRLTEVEHYDHADLTVGVGAGTTVAQLNAMVGKDSLMFACDPPFAERATVGGVLATGSQGPPRHGYGALRDFCIGIRFVTGDGRRAKGGGRVVKNVAGYDLMKLLIGSYGTLAVITSASFKLFPAPRQTRTFVSEFASWQEVLKFRDLLLRTALAPMCMEVVSPEARRLIRREATSDTWAICVRASGSDAVLARYRKELGTAVTWEVEGENERALWQGIENCCDGERMWDRMDVIVPPAKVGDVLQALDDTTDQRFGYAAVGRIALGHLRVFTPVRATGGTQPANVFIDKLREHLKTEASVSVESWATPWPIPPPHLASMRAVKQALDPNNVLRGRAIF